MAKDNDRKFKEIHLEAEKAGRAAAEAAGVEMISVTDGKEVWGPFPICGFGWVHFAGNTAWGRWAKANGIARDDYPKGLCIWVHQFEQSYDLKLAYARAYAEVLKSHGIDAVGRGRLD